MVIASRSATFRTSRGPIQRASLSAFGWCRRCGGPGALRPVNCGSSDSLPAKVVQLAKLLDHEMGRSVEWLYAVAGCDPTSVGNAAVASVSPPVRESGSRSRETVQTGCLRDDLLEIRRPASLGCGISKAKRPRAVRGQLGNGAIERELVARIGVHLVGAAQVDDDVERRGPDGGTRVVCRAIVAIGVRVGDTRTIGIPRSRLDASMTLSGSSGSRTRRRSSPSVDLPDGTRKSVAHGAERSDEGVRACPMTLCRRWAEQDHLDAGKVRRLDVIDDGN